MKSGRNPIQIWLLCAVLQALISRAQPVSKAAANADPNLISFTMRLGNQHYNTNYMTGKFLVLSGVASYESVVIRSSPDTSGFGGLIYEDLQKNAVWTPYDGIVRMQLGPTDGVYQVWLGLKGAGANARPMWVGTDVTLIRKKPEVFITNPTNEVVTQPYLQLQGYSTLPLDSVYYGIGKTADVTANEPGSIINHTLDSETGQYTADYFQCYDIHLSDGLNFITLRATDPAGNVFTTNLNVTFDLSKAVAPVIQLEWPQDGMDICGNSFTLRGHTEDASSTVSASITDTNGNTTVVNGIVERTGMLWVDNVPLPGGTNRLTLTIKNSAGLSSTTNISISHSSFVLKMDEVKGDLWLPTVTVTGMESDATYSVWVNGVKAVVMVNTDGTGKWVAQNVPVMPGGVASFDMEAYSPGEKQPDGSYANGSVAAAGKSLASSTATSNGAASVQNPAQSGISLITTPVQPVFLKIAQSNSTLYFTWSAVSNQTYQLQFATDLVLSNWTDLAVPITATSNSVSTTDTIGRDAHRFYRVHLLQ